MGEGNGGLPVKQATRLAWLVPEDSESYNFLVWVSSRSSHFSKSHVLEMGLLGGIYLGEKVQQS